MVAINKALNLVITVESDEETFYVHSTPILREAFEKYFFIMTKAYAEIAGNGLISQGDRISSLMLTEVAEEMGKLQQAKELLQEIRRLSNVIMATPKGWETIPLDVACGRNLIDDDAVLEIESHLVFFTLISQVLSKKNAAGLLSQLKVFLQWSLTPSTPMEFITGLQTSTETVNIGEMATI